MRSFLISISLIIVGALAVKAEERIDFLDFYFFGCFGSESEACASLTELSPFERAVEAELAALCSQATFTQECSEELEYYEETDLNEAAARWELACDAGYPLNCISYLSFLNGQADSKQQAMLEIANRTEARMNQLCEAGYGGACLALSSMLYADARARGLSDAELGSEIIPQFASYLTDALSAFIEACEQGHQRQCESLETLLRASLGDYIKWQPFEGACGRGSQLSCHALSALKLSALLFVEEIDQASVLEQRQLLEELCNDNVLSSCRFLTEHTMLYPQSVARELYDRPLKKTCATGMFHYCDDYSFYLELVTGNAATVAEAETMKRKGYEGLKSRCSKGIADACNRAALLSIRFNEENQRAQLAAEGCRLGDTMMCRLAELEQK